MGTDSEHAVARIPAIYELDAMKTIADALDDLTDEQIRRILWWASDRYVMPVIRQRFLDAVADQPMPKLMT